MIRVDLNAEEREELRKRSHERDIHPRTRDRLEMVRLADAGWSIPRIARHLGYHEQTVRKYIKRFVTGGFDRLPDEPHLGRRAKVSEDISPTKWHSIPRRTSSTQIACSLEAGPKPKDSAVTSILVILYAFTDLEWRSAAAGAPLMR